MTGKGFRVPQTAAAERALDRETRREATLGRISIRDYVYETQEAGVMRDGRVMQQRGSGAKQRQ